jgi:4-hydroxybutyrate CoA-transferase
MKKSVKIQPKDIVNIIPKGARVFMGSCCSEPQTLAEALGECIEQLTAVELHTANLGTPCAYVRFNPGEHLKEHLKIKTFYVAPALKKALKEEWADYIPCNYADLPRLIEEGVFKPDVAMIQLSPPDENGFCSLGIGVDYHHELIDSAKLVVAEVNKQMPRTSGNTLIPFSVADYWIESDRALLEISPGVIGSVEKRIGENVAELIPDDAIIQIGIGNIIEAVLQALRAKRRLSIHSGTLGDGVIDLIEQGVVANRTKKINPGKTVATSLMGTARLYHYAHLNPLIELYPVVYTHNPATFLRLPGLIAINSALQADLFGQVNAETLNGLQVGGVGGQLDFMNGAVMAGGKSIIAFPATAGNGKSSRIVPALETADAVTTPRTKVHYVVTEFGIACLKGKSLKQRATALIKIAHPDFREELSFWSRKFLN